ncbi:hypothetical protein LX16_4631 [Stackebrandtia albiflava]|uniref:DNA-binding protein YbaB n=1 Tax=Stackebrandtia albiflava TaxID=406432 RepID=A0A562UQF8_9ACTN|nr:hypothetical protein [Stackebrandtia albiflava]TWJ07850.1 hypothetical protein LX16_4631 [Stackebrandtia albiflava]
MSTIDDTHVDSDAGYAAKLRALEDDLAMLRGARERMSTAGARLRATVEAAKEKVYRSTSEDGLAEVECLGSGKVHRITVDSTRYNEVDEARLCEAVVEARTKARTIARGARPTAPHRADPAGR